MTSSATASSVGVWDALWRHPPGARRDDRQVLREARSPRWALVREALVATFGQLEGIRTVELGSGRGDLSALLAAEGAAVTLVDYSDRALAQARARFDRMGLAAEFVNADVLVNPGGLAERFDVACSLGVIEHFKGRQRARAVKAHRQVLRDGGMAVISVPHALGVPYRLWKLYLELRGWWPYGVEIPYGKGELLRLATAAGFARVGVHATGFWQSIGDHWGRSVLGASPDWVERRSLLDSTLGGTLTMLAWADGVSGGKGF